VVIVNGLGILDGTGTEGDLGPVTVAGAFTMIPAPLPHTPTTGPGLGPCDGDFIADGAFVVAEIP
jgi:hypothetical protein